MPMVCTYHGLYNPPTEGRRYIADAINKLQAWMYKRFARTVVLVAEYSGLYLLERKVPKSKLEVVYNGIVENEPALEPVVLKSDGVSIGMAGRLDAIKGLNFLIKAIRKSGSVWMKNSTSISLVTVQRRRLCAIWQENLELRS